MEAKLVERLEAAVARLEAISLSGSRAAEGGGDAAETDPSIVAFEDLMRGYVGRATAAAEKIGGQVLDVTKVVAEAFEAQKQLLVVVKQSQKPDMAGLAEFLKPLNEVIVKANKMTEGRRSDFFNHLKTAADSLSALAWIAFTGKDCGMSMPIAHVEESWQMAEFYNNKILVEYRNKDPNHVEWAKALKELYVPGLRDYVKSHYPLGPVWSATGKTTVAAPAKAPTSSGPAPPGPPPPPPASLFSSESPQSSSSRPKVGMAAVFQEINTGKPATAGLRKVTDDMKTKNRPERTGIVGAGEKESGASSRSFSKAGPPKLELQVRKWVVENQIGRKDLVIDACDSKQSVYVFGCKDSVLQIKGKVNNITVDRCTKMGIVFTDVVAACEIVNCNGVEVQCQGSAPTISVDNTSGCQLYLSKDSLEASITTAKSSEINVLLPGAGADDDWGEHALPQQFVHVYKDGKFVTTPVSHSGGQKEFSSSPPRPSNSPTTTTIAAPPVHWPEEKIISSSPPRSSTSPARAAVVVPPVQRPKWSMKAVRAKACLDLWRSRWRACSDLWKSPVATSRFGKGFVVCDGCGSAFRSLGLRGLGAKKKLPATEKLTEV